MIALAIAGCAAEDIGALDDQTLEIASLAEAAPVWLYPSSDDEVVDLANPLRWTPPPGGSWLFIGSTPGASDLLYTGRIDRSDYYVPSLPVGETLYAQIWTPTGDTWLHSDIRFQVGSRPVASFVHPRDGATDVDLATPLSWTSIPGAEIYYLTIGTEPGARDLFDSAGLPPSVLSREVIDLPAMQTIHARIWTMRAGVWAHEDAAFAVSRTRVADLYRPPAGGVLPDEQGFRFAWSEVPGALGYKLQVGTCRGCRDVAVSGALRGREWSIARLPTGIPLHARLFTRRGAGWTYRDSIFSAGAPLAPAVIARPFDGQARFSAATPFSWADVPTATAYRLQIGTAAGANDVHDSGPIRVNRRLVAGLPVGVPLFGSLGTENDGLWRTTSFTFTVASAAVPFRARLRLAEWLTVRARRMADMGNGVLQGSPLHGVVRQSGRLAATCWDYARTLVALLDQAGAGLQQRTLQVAFNPNGYEVHAVVELVDPASQAGFVLDPTFMVAIHRASDGGWMSPEGISSAVRNSQFDDIAYRFLAPSGETLIRRYYIDYPLLYLNLLRGPTGDLPPVTPYMTQAPLPLSGAMGTYVLQCAQGGAASARLDGTATSLACDGVEATSRAFMARAIEPVGDPSSVRVFSINRYQF